MKFLNELKRRFNQFMRSRYGNDELNMFIMILYLIAILIFYFFKNHTIRTYGSLLATFLLVILLFRTYSRNYHQRRHENELFLKFRDKLIKSKPKSNYKVFNCPNCKQKVRVPRGRGKIEIVCPRCGYKFTKRS